jgi:hypothetical protein
LLEEATAVHIEEMVKYKSNKVQTANRGSWFWFKVES